jgi:pilus assembly protein CpaE
VSAPGSDIGVRLQIGTPTVREAFERLVASVRGLRPAEAHGPADLLVLEIGAEPLRDFELVAQLLQTGGAREVFLTCGRSEPEILLHALRSGAKEFFVQPLKIDEVRATLERYAARAARAVAANHTGQVIYLVGSKGGVGTTTVAVNLAAELRAGNGERAVAVIDMNLLFGEVPLFLDVEPAFNWGEVAKNITRLDATYLMGVLTRHASGVYVLPSPSQLDRLHAATPDTVERLLRVMRGEFDHIIIDGGQSIDEISLKLMELSDTVLVLSILSLPCLINVRRLLETFTRLGYPRPERVRVVVNRYHKHGGITLKEAEEGIGRPIACTIPNDFADTMSAINQGKLLRDVAPRADVTRNLQDLAKSLAGADAAPGRG